MRGEMRKLVEGGGWVCGERGGEKREGEIERERGKSIQQSRELPLCCQSLWIMSPLVFLLHTHTCSLTQLLPSPSNQPLSSLPLMKRVSWQGN